MKKPMLDLKITGLANERCYVIEGRILRIYLQLSDSPPLGWSYMFTMVWQGVSYSAKRPVGIEGDTVWIECAPDEVKQFHLAEIEKAVAQTSAHYLASQQERRVAEQRQKELDSLL